MNRSRCIKVKGGEDKADSSLLAFKLHCNSSLSKWSTWRGIPNDIQISVLNSLVIGSASHINGKQGKIYLMMCLVWDIWVLVKYAQVICQISIGFESLELNKENWDRMGDLIGL